MNKKANTIITKYSVTMVMLLIAVWALSMAQSSIAQAQSESWHFNPANGHYYRLTDWMSWGNAEAQAVQWGGHLVTINDPEEELWLQEQFYPPDMRTGYWIGLNDIEIEGNWVWSSGEMPGYENWCPGEPNDVNGEDSANMEGFPYDNPTQYCWNDNPDYNHRQGIVEKSLLEIAIDIKPTSCPNPLNVVEKGVLPVAILGTVDFDASTIDPASVQLAGVSPLRWSWEDVATPYEPYTGKGDAYDCNEYGADGAMDLTLKFDAQEVVAALGDVYDGDVLVIDLTGHLQEAYGGTPFFGEDVVRISIH
jgi:hypothetical protein